MYSKQVANLDESDAAPLADFLQVAVVCHLLNWGVLLHEPLSGRVGFFSRFSTGCHTCLWTGLGWLEFSVFQCLPNYAWADVNCGRSGRAKWWNTLIKETQPRSTSRWDNLYFYSQAWKSNSLFLTIINFQIPLKVTISPRGIDSHITHSWSY